MAGIIGIVFIVLFQDITVNNESEYYVLKEAMEAAMLESIDLPCYRNSNRESTNQCAEGTVKIVKQKFVENFTRRFAESISGNANEFQIEFYDIIESPPKATIVVKALQNGGTFEEEFTIVNNLDGILEYDEKLQGGLNIAEIERENYKLIEDNPNGISTVVKIEDTNTSNPDEYTQENQGSPGDKK